MPAITCERAAAGCVAAGVLTFGLGTVFRLSRGAAVPGEDRTAARWRAVATCLRGRLPEPALLGHSNYPFYSNGSVAVGRNETRRSSNSDRSVPSHGPRGPPLLR